MRQLQTEKESAPAPIVLTSPVEVEAALVPAGKASLAGDDIIGEEQIEPMLAQIRRQRSRLHRFAIGYWAATLLAGFPIIYWMMSAPNRTVPILMLFYALVFSGVLMLVRHQYLWVRQTKALAGQNDKRALGAYLELLSGTYIIMTSIRSQKEAKQQMIRLLEQIETGDGELLNAAQRSKMRVFLGGVPVDISLALGHSQRRIGYLLRRPHVNRPYLPRQQDTPLAIAMLRAISKIGNREDLLLVEKLAQGQMSGKEAAIQEAAIACLPPLRQRIEEQSNPQLLLRASIKTEVGGQDLLRAVHGVTVADSDQLLRAAPEALPQDA